MECDYTHLNHNLLVSPKKKSGHQECDYKEGLLQLNIIMDDDLTKEAILTLVLGSQSRLGQDKRK
jgi:hypothetical protein